MYKIQNIKLDFIESMRGQRKSTNTIKGYIVDLERFEIYINNTISEQMDVRDIKVKHLNKFISFLGNTNYEKGNTGIKEYSIGTINRNISTLKTFFGYLAMNEIIDKDPSLQLEKLKEKKQNPKYLKIAEIKRLFEVISGTNEIRDRAIITIFLDTGLRLSELCNLKIRDIDFKSKTCIVEGKGKKERKIYFSGQSIESIEEYLKTRTDNIEYLFISREKNKMHTTSIQNVVGNNLKKANIGGVSTHNLRHTFATMQYAQTKNLRAVQKLLGHANSSTTDIYTHVDDEVLKDMADNNLLGNIING